MKKKMLSSNKKLAEKSERLWCQAGKAWALGHTERARQLEELASSFFAKLDSDVRRLMSSKWAASSHGDEGVGSMYVSEFHITTRVHGRSLR